MINLNLIISIRAPGKADVSVPVQRQEKANVPI